MIYSFRCILSWQLLSGAAGMVNGFAFLLCSEFVTHMTGTVTRVGLEWEAVSLMFEYFFIVTSFVLGAAISVAAINVRSPQAKRAPWVVPLCLVTSILSAVAISGALGVFGPICSTFSQGSPAVFMLSFLAFAMGIQNAAIPGASGLGVRTTHLSGHATNLGIQLATVCFSQGKARQTALHGVFLRGGKIISFAIGAAFAVPLTNRLGFLTLLAPAACVLSAILISQSADGP
ncbi:MAG TPA: YoaK family protein [Planctomicrobium sp.]|nr:YoaK family protein [Planctomicrobium sp.]